MFKKAVSILAACALCVGFVIPASAATMKSDKATYDLSNPASGTWDFHYYDGTYSVHLVPAGTVVKATSGNVLSVTTYAEQDGTWDGSPSFENPTSVTIEGNGVVYKIESVDPKSIDPDTIAPASSVDEGIWLKAGGSAPAESTTPSTTPSKPAGTASAAATLSCDTNGTVDLAANESYTAKITIPGNTKSFHVSVGDGNIASASLIKKVGLNYYYTVTPKGKAGTGTGIYASVNGAKPQLLFGVKLTAAAPVSVKSDTTGRLTMQKGSTYWYKMTVSDGKTPATFSTGNGSVVKIAQVKNSGNGVYLVKVAAVGNPGEGTAIYSTLKGGTAASACEIVINA